MSSNRHLFQTRTRNIRRFATRRSGFTLVELMIVISLLAILAAIVVPQVTSAIGSGRAEAMATSVTSIRELILYHDTSDDPLTTMAASGHPDNIYPHWFASGKLPNHSWSGSQMVIKVVDGGPADLFPATKTFDTASKTAVSAWYNRTNGWFCVLVGAESSDADTLASFNAANSVSASSLIAVN